MSAAAYAGLMLWNEQREEWVGNKPRPQSQGSRESVIRFDPSSLMLSVGYKPTTV
jgi:hypothetical protein